MADDDLVAVVSTMGAPLVGQERLVDPELSVKPVRALEGCLGRRFQAVMPVEIGDGNGLKPFLVAAGMDIPVIRCRRHGSRLSRGPDDQLFDPRPHDVPDGAGRHPRQRHRHHPCRKRDLDGWLSRAVCTALGSTAPTAKAPRTGREVKDCGILHSVTKAIRIGRAVLDGEGGRLLFSGKVTDVNRRTTAEQSSTASVTIPAAASRSSSRTNG